MAVLLPLASSLPTLGGVRAAVAGEIRSMIGASDSELAAQYATPLGDHGLFGPDSVTWRVHSDLAMLVGGVRALLIQTMHPQVMAGVADHSDYRSDPLGRLNRTARFVGVTTFGGTKHAEAAIRGVRAVHSRVSGVTPRGVEYEANDPQNLCWVHVTEMDSFVRAYQRYSSTPLSPAQIDRYFAETAEVARRLGATGVPTSAAEIREYYRSVRGELEVGAQARTALRWLLNPPLAIAARPAYAVLLSAAIGLIPPSVRHQLWLFAPPMSDVLLVRPATRSMLSVMGWALADESSSAELAAQRVAAAG